MDLTEFQVNNFTGGMEQGNLSRGIVKCLDEEIGDEEPYYSNKLSIFSFIWAGLAALNKASTI
jgi:hypothetical protein